MTLLLQQNDDLSAIWRACQTLATAVRKGGAAAANSGPRPNLLMPRHLILDSIASFLRAVLDLFSAVWPFRLSPTTWFRRVLAAAPVSGQAPAMARHHSRPLAGVPGPAQSRGTIFACQFGHGGVSGPEGRRMRPVPFSSRSRHSVPPLRWPPGQSCRFTLQARLRGELGPVCEMICAGLEEAIRFGQREFPAFTERNPWIGLDWLQRQIWILLDQETESLSS